MTNVNSYRSFLQASGVKGISSLSGMSKRKLIELTTHLLEKLESVTNELEIFKERYRELELNASIDAATGLYNREYFTKVGNYLFEQSKRAQYEGGNAHFALVIVDVNGLKAINDTLGHEAGDLLISKSASMIEDSFQRHTDIHSRIGGDEFALLLPKATAEFIERRFRALNRDVSFETKDKTRVDVKVAYGVSFFNDQQAFSDMYAEADKAMYENKKANKESGLTTSWTKPAVNDLLPQEP